METNTATSENALQPKQHLTGKVLKITIAGAILDVGEKLPGVVHISQLRKEPVNRVEDAVQIGQVVDVWVRRLRDDRIELTMIQPLGLEWREIEVDQLVKGKVERLETYGAFVDIGAERAGLVHISEISHDYIKNPAEVLKVGDEVEAKVLEVNRRKKQIRLSIKATLPKPEEILAEVTQADSRKPSVKRGDKKKKAKQEDWVEEPGEKEPELTAFQIAYQKAQDRSEKQGHGKKKYKVNLSQENEEIFSRTLKNRITEK